MRLLPSKIFAVLKPKRRWYQYSLRTLFVFVTLCAIACSWFAVKMQRGRKQEEAVKAIVKAGEYVMYDYETEEPVSPVPRVPPQPSGPAWMRKLLGDNFFAKVVGVGVRNKDGLGHLKELPNLEVLDLSKTHVTDAGVEHLRGLTTLEVLCLYETEITDAGLEYFRELTSLRQLFLNRTDVTEEGIQKLQKALPNCKIEH